MAKSEQLHKFYNSKAWFNARNYKLQETELGLKKDTEMNAKTNADDIFLHKMKQEDLKLINKEYETFMKDKKNYSGQENGDQRYFRIKSAIEKIAKDEKIELK
jgi:hypothetical protein